MGKGGSKADTSGLEQATQEATELQRQIYEQSRQDVQPWYQAGSAGIGRLSDLLGLQGGSVQSREQIYQDMLPQYTQQQTTGAANQYVDPSTGQVTTIADPSTFFGSRYAQEAQGEESVEEQRARGLSSTGEYGQALDALGFQPHQTQLATTDYSSLNTAVDEALGRQETPEDYGSLLQEFGTEQFEQDPGYQFRQDEAQKALERGMSAQGVTLGGGGLGSINPQVAQALQERSQGLASQEYGDAYNRYNQDQLNKYNMLMGVSGMGAGITGQMQQGGQQYAGQVGGLTTDLASAQLNAQIAQDAKPSMFSSLLGAGSQLAGATYGGGGWSFSDERLKENIKFVRKEKGHNIYEFDFRDGSGRFEGLIAQRVQDIEPDAVMESSNGYLMVDYDKLGLKMERVDGV